MGILCAQRNVDAPLATVLEHFAVVKLHAHKPLGADHALVARLRLARAYLAAGGDARGARGATRPTFDPGDADHFAAAASPVLAPRPA